MILSRILALICALSSSVSASPVPYHRRDESHGGNGAESFIGFPVTTSEGVKATTSIDDTIGTVQLNSSGVQVVRPTTTANPVKTTTSIAIPPPGPTDTYGPELTLTLTST
ncbi:hypothetical protein HDU67_008561, partial [Dinochytrium kinnereticum]